MRFNTERQNRLAEYFHQLHHRGETLVLPNAWDCLSAKIYEKSGFRAVATSSASVSWAYGYPDGEYIPADLLLENVAHISRVVDLPVTADIEGGFYWEDNNRFAEYVEKLIEAGAVGLNLEDARSGVKGLIDLDYQLKRLEIVKSIAHKKKIPFFLNARTDAMVLPSGDTDKKIEVAVARAHAFQEAGADGIFIPFISDIETVKRLKAQIQLPLNVLISKMLDVKELKALKVERISLGARPAINIYGKLKKIIDHVQQSNDWETLFQEDISYETINNWMKKRD